MTFTKFLTDVQPSDSKIIPKTRSEHMKIDADESVLTEQNNTSSEAAEILRDNGFKLKLVTPTLFGIQIDFAKHYDEEELTVVLKDFTLKFKNKSVFIID